jgi:hypothetical protein
MNNANTRIVLTKIFSCPNYQPFLEIDGECHLLCPYWLAIAIALPPLDSIIAMTSIAECWLPAQLTTTAVPFCFNRSAMSFLIINQSRRWT